MARTKASVGAKLTSGKSSKAVKTSSSAPSRTNSAVPSTSKGSSGGGNPYHPRPTPKWQKPITSFFGEPSDSVNSDDDEIATGSKTSKRRHTQRISSDTESDIEGAGDDLDVSTTSNIDLPPLSPDENSHKIVEYFEKTKRKSSSTPQSVKGKGKGKGKGKQWNESHKSSDQNCIDKNSNNGSSSFAIDNNNPESDDKENKLNGNVNEIDKEPISKAEKRESDNFENSAAKRIKVCV